MKNLLLLSGLLCAFSLSAQHVSGIYSGTLVNDSTGKVQTYELGLSEYKDRLTGYAYTTFVSNDTFYYSLKRITAVKRNDELVVEDEKMVAHNFPEPPAKNVRQINIIPLSGVDTLRSFTGTWKTNRTKIYYSLSGGMDMRKSDSNSSSLVRHLGELGLLRPNNSQPATRPGKEIATTGNGAGTRPVPLVIPADQRKKNILQTLEYASDSLLLSFYDNGVVDGDTISVFLNGKNIISKTRLMSAATRQVVQLPSEGDVELVLVAENLGTIPPNTGLLVVTDGTKKYEIRFSADLQSNASILFRRKRLTP